MQKIFMPDLTRRCEQCARCTRDNGSYQCGAGLNPALAGATSTEREQVSQMAVLCDGYLWAPLSLPFYRRLMLQRMMNRPDFSPAELATKFAPFYRSDIDRDGLRLKVQHYGTVEHGRVAVSTGWRPVFLLMRNSRQRGSGVVLKNDTMILGIKQSTRKGAPYVAVEDNT